MKSFGSQNNAAGAYAFTLKLPVAGYRNRRNGSLGSVGTFGGYWSGRVSSSDSRSLGFNGSFASIDASMQTWSRTNGFFVRCIKEEKVQSS